MKRSGLLRRTPLRRVSKVQPRPRERSQRSVARPEQCSRCGRPQSPTCCAEVPARRGYADRERFTEYMLWVKSLTCLMSGVWGRCQGHVEADHAGNERGLNRKAHDSTVIPMCQGHHAKRFPHAWTHLERRAWLAAAVLYTQAVARARGIAVPHDERAPAPVMLSVHDAWEDLMRCTPRAT